MLYIIATLYYSTVAIIHGYNDEFGKGTYSFILCFVSIQILFLEIKEKCISKIKIPAILALILILLSVILGFHNVINGLLLGAGKTHIEGAYDLISGIILINIGMALAKYNE